MAWAPIALAAASTVMSYEGKKQAGKAQQQADEFQAAQLKQNAGQEIASGQIAALNQDRNTSYVLSQARARAAASGGGASDPTVINLMAQIAGEGAYRSNVARYEGESKARGMNLQASGLEFSGRQAVKGANLAAASTLLSGASGAYGMYEKYNAGGISGGGFDPQWQDSVAAGPYTQ